MVVTPLLIGSVFGVRHAFEADHVAAVATLVEGDGQASSTGAIWGVGHSIPIVILGGVFLVADIPIPASIATVFELLVVAILIVLGVRVIAGYDAIGTSLLRHFHEGEGDEASHLHLSLGGKDIGIAHSHADEESLAVGVVHGLAGSGGVIVALVSAAPNIAAGAAFLIGFSIASVTAMAAAAWGWGHAVGHTDVLRKVAGVGSIAVGLLLLAEIVAIPVPL